MSLPGTAPKIRNRADVQALEAATPHDYLPDDCLPDDCLPVDSTREPLACGRGLYGDRVAFRFLETGAPGGPDRAERRCGRG